MNITSAIPWLGSVGHVLLFLVAGAVGVAALWGAVLGVRFLGTRR